ncbi:MAG: GntR family transcriptional regulator [Gammaproteobacteria bacterium]
MPTELFQKRAESLKRKNMMSSARSARSPKYKKLAKTLIKKIESGRLSIGDRLPGELDLVAQYKVSRYTVREALRVLEQAGQVSRARGIGTVVTSERPFRLFQQPSISINALTQLPPQCKRQRIRKRTVRVRRPLADLLGCDTNTKWVRYSMIRTHPSHPLPLCWQDAYVRPSLAQSCEWMLSADGPGTTKDYETLSLESRETVINVIAGEIPKHMASPLRVAEKSAALIITGRYLDSDAAPSLIGVVHYPAGRFIYSFRYTQ